MSAILKSILISMRPQQWYKNLIIFICIIFSNNIFNLGMWINLFLVFAIFCMLAGSHYILNDIKDVEKDLLHPKKKFRPIAAGILPKKQAFFISSSIMVLSLVLSFMISPMVGLAGLFYLINSMLYSAYFKNYAIADAIFIAMGFVIRAVAGCLTIKVTISPWLTLCVFLLALVLAFGKRRNELLIAKESRKCLSEYNVSLSENLLNLSVSMLLMSYALYTVSVNSSMMLSLPFAFFGIFRYVQMVHLNDFGGETELILLDRQFIFNLLCWFFLIFFVLYGGVV